MTSWRPREFCIAGPRLRVEGVGNIVWRLLVWLRVMVNVLLRGLQTPGQQGHVRSINE